MNEDFADGSKNSLDFTIYVNSSIPDSNVKGKKKLNRKFK